MRISSDPWQYPDPEQSQLRLVEVPAAVLHALARGEAVDTGGHPMTSYITGNECAGLWRMRSRQTADTPTDAPWVTRFVYVPGENAPVGVAGFHGPPDEAGMVEVGYRIDPKQRRKGYARQALETLLAVARAHPDVRVVRATISPDNVASRSLVKGYGFEDVGEQWDDEDGLEIIFEVGVDAGPPTSGAR
ncbi:GNAT family N-acetyltransferase [Geodermatophilus sp. DF01-2]|uniref:GNAT family N-acetyltransferase n=1 Tax=Geodermatophilus sp. DF01-2 TaxID=2559610 RepID=UPI001ADD957D|nr:GNAT family N-acetyltransferase [Geodermatophilus sp. DF01_2]